MSIQKEPYERREVEAMENTSGIDLTKQHFSLKWTSNDWHRVRRIDNFGVEWVPSIHIVDENVENGSYQQADWCFMNADECAEQMCPGNPNWFLKTLAESTDKDNISRPRFQLCIDSSGNCRDIQFQLSSKALQSIKPVLLDVLKCDRPVAFTSCPADAVSSLKDSSGFSDIAIATDVWLTKDHTRLNITDDLVENSCIKTAVFLQTFDSLYQAGALQQHKTSIIFPQIMKLAIIACRLASALDTGATGTLSASVTYEYKDGIDSMLTFIAFTARDCLEDMAIGNPDLPCNAKLRSFACVLVAIMRVCGHAVFLGESTPQIFSRMTTAESATCEFLHDLQFSSKRIAPKVTIPCANHLTWGTGTFGLDDGDTIGCPVSFDVECFTEEAKTQSIRSYRDHEFFGSPCCDRHCYESAVAIWVARGKLKSASSVRMRSYALCDAVFIHPYL